MPVKTIAQTLFLFFISSFVSDLFHFASHKALKSKNRLFRWLGVAHIYHHRFFCVNLHLKRDLTQQNIIFHHIPEYFIHLLTSAVFLLCFSKTVVFSSMLLLTANFIHSMFQKGETENHTPLDLVHRPQKRLFVDKHYHAYHHVDYDSHYGSLFKSFDIVFGTAIKLTGKTIALSGSRGGFGSNFSKLLSQENVAEIRTIRYNVDYSENDFQKLETILKDVDILVLLHGSKDNPHFAHVTSFLKMIEIFLAVNPRKTIPLEIWAIGSESEFHPSFNKRAEEYAKSKRTFAKYAKSLYLNKDVFYRHIVVSRFSSGMNGGIMTSHFAAKWALFLIKRGFQYVPVTYTGIALLNYIYFRYFLRPLKVGEISQKIFNH